LIFDAPSNVENPSPIYVPYRIYSIFDLLLPLLSPASVFNLISFVFYETSEFWILCLVFYLSFEIYLRYL
jgi:hypothetical protein